MRRTMKVGGLQFLEIPKTGRQKDEGDTTERWEVLDCEWPLTLYKINLFWKAETTVEGIHIRGEGKFDSANAAIRDLWKKAAERRRRISEFTDMLCAKVP